MNTNSIIEQACKLSNKYCGNVYELAKDLNVNIVGVDLKGEKSLGLTINLVDTPTIIIKNELDDYTKTFVLAHELGHIILHKEVTRFFDARCYKEKTEAQANLFATVFLRANYSDSKGLKVQKIINYMCANYLNEKVLDYCELV